MTRWLLPCTLLALTTAARADDAVALFNGKDLAGWTARHPERNKWKAGTAALDPADPAKIAFDPSPANPPQLVNTVAASSDLVTERKFADCRLEIEVMVPKGSNSGIYLMGEYEVQVLDSYGKEKLAYGDMGGIYNTAPPRVNASRKPGEWQTLVIDFRAPRFADGKKTENAKFLKVVLNGQVIHENVEVKRPTTSSLTGKESPTGPLMIQGDHGPVAYRGIRLYPR